MKRALDAITIRHLIWTGHDMPFDKNKILTLSKEWYLEEDCTNWMGVCTFFVLWIDTQMQIIAKGNKFVFNLLGHILIAKSHIPVVTSPT